MRDWVYGFAAPRIVVSNLPKKVVDQAKLCDAPFFIFAAYIVEAGAELPIQYIHNPFGGVISVEVD